MALAFNWDRWNGLSYKKILGKFTPKMFYEIDQFAAHKTLV